MTASIAQALPKLEKYELLEEIGAGGMATVYRAKDPRLGREVAVKLIHKHLRGNREVATRFVAEAKAAAKLRHPGIVEVYDVSSEDTDERYLVSELVRGTTLRKLIQDHGVFPAEIGAAIVVELCDALTHAHESGIIHRDIKPENVLVELPADRLAASGRPEARENLRSSETRRAQARREPDESGEGPVSESDATLQSSERASSRRGNGARGVVIKITDFGIAKLLDAQGVTSTGQVLGSPAHMAPEQIEGAEVDARTDVFALGVLMYECIVGHLPFEGKNPAQVLRRVLDGQYSPAEVERSTVGGTWSKILDGALARDMDQRTETPEALASLVRAELSSLGVTDPEDELEAYFEGAEEYEEELTSRLVKKLVGRGERARRKRDVPGAACAFNRALALAPNDPNILKRVTRLTTSATRQRFIKRVGVMVVGSAVLGAAAFGIARLLKADPVLENPTADRPDPAPVRVKAPDPAVIDTSERVAKATPTAKPSASGRRRIKIDRSALPPISEPRSVKFQVNPKGASISVDGASVSHAAMQKLTVGPHQVTMPESACCLAKTIQVSVKPAPEDAPDQPQHIDVIATFKDATVRLGGAPPGGSAKCPLVGTLTAAGLTVKMQEATRTFDCQFPNRGETVQVHAGRTTTVEWPR